LAEFDLYKREIVPTVKQLKDAGGGGGSSGCGIADLKDSSSKSKHYLSSPYLFPVLPTQYKHYQPNANKIQIL